MSNPLAVKALDLSFGEVKAIKFVRTVAGMRKYQQDKGSIIIRDGAQPLDALVAMPNDIAGYEKVSDKNGNDYYIGREGQGWVIRNPQSGEIMNTTAREEDAFAWLNEKVGGREGGLSTPHDPFASSPNVKPNDSQERRNLRRALSDPNYELTQGQANAIDNMTDNALREYQRARDRGLSHEQSLSEARRQDARRVAKEKIKKGKK